LSKAADIYWDSSHGYEKPQRQPAASRRRRPVERQTVRRTPRWLSVLIAVSIFTMVFVAINFRAFTELREEANRHAQLTQQIQNLTDENLALQEEIHLLKTDPRAIEREARELGIDLKKQKVPMPVN
jgi:cell division protein FtsB